MTMNHAVISCLHANLAAVEAVLDDIDSQGIKTITCLGDLVGYGPQPNEVVELIRQRNIPPSWRNDGGIGPTIGRTKH